MDFLNTIGIKIRSKAPHTAGKNGEACEISVSECEYYVDFHSTRGIKNERKTHATMEKNIESLKDLRFPFANVRKRN